MLYSNVYQHTDKLGHIYDFCGNLHPCREALEVAAEFELKHEPRTRRLGVLRIKPKEGVRD